MNVITICLIVYSLILTTVSIIIYKKMVYWKKIGVRGLLGGYGSFVDNSHFIELNKEALALELGFNLIKLIDNGNNSVLLQRISEVRKNFRFQ